MRIALITNILLLIIFIKVIQTDLTIVPRISIAEILRKLSRPQVLTESEMSNVILIMKCTQKNSSRFNQNISFTFSRLNSFVSKDTHQWWLSGGELQF